MIFQGDFTTELEFARRIAVSAGRILVAMRGKSDLYSKEKDRFDLVSEADLASHRSIEAELRAAFPHDLLLSEEGDPTNPLIGRCWIADPLDGTANFLHGQDHVAVSLALFIDGVPAVGVVHAPFIAQTFWATAGGGAYCNDQRLNITLVREPRHALVGTGFPHHRGDISAMINRLHPILREFADIRRLAAPALDICWVAAGRLDALVDRLKIWDIAAAALIATEAGAITHRLSDAPAFPEPIDGWDYIVAPAPLAKFLAAIIE